MVHRLVEVETLVFVKQDRDRAVAFHAAYLLHHLRDPIRVFHAVAVHQEKIARLYHIGASRRLRRATDFARSISSCTCGGFRISWSNAL